MEWETSEWQNTNSQVLLPFKRSPLSSVTLKAVLVIKMIMKYQAKSAFPGGIFDHIIIVKGYMKGWEGEKQKGEIKCVTECGRVLAFSTGQHVIW